MSDTPNTETTLAGWWTLVRGEYDWKLFLDFADSEVTGNAHAGRYSLHAMCLSLHRYSPQPITGGLASARETVRSKFEGLTLVVGDGAFDKRRGIASGELRRTVSA